MTNDAVVCEKCGSELATYRHQNRKHGHYFKDVSQLDFI